MQSRKSTRAGPTRPNTHGNAELDLGLGESTVHARGGLGRVSAQEGVLLENDDVSAALNDGVGSRETGETAADNDDLRGHGKIGWVIARERAGAGDGSVVGTKSHSTVTRKVTSPAVMEHGQAGKTRLETVWSTAEAAAGSQGRFVGLQVPTPQRPHRPQASTVC